MKWKDKKLSELLKHVQDYICNPYIRERDKTLFGRCISCKSGITQAGHRFSVGAHSSMRFMVNNIHGQEISCNHFKGGNLDEYDKGLIKRHGQEYLDKLKEAEVWHKKSRKWDRFTVIAIGETYKYLMENKIWVFTTDEFNDYLEKILKNEQSK